MSIFLLLTEHRILSTVLFLIIIPITTNILKQIFFRDPHKPPVVWHWVPKIGSTVDYGQDPFDFFFRCREKVRYGLALWPISGKGGVCLVGLALVLGGWTWILGLKHC